MLIKKLDPYADIPNGLSSSEMQRGVIRKAYFLRFPIFRELNRYYLAHIDENVTGIYTWSFVVSVDLYFTRNGFGLRFYILKKLVKGIH